MNMKHILISGVAFFALVMALLPNVTRAYEVTDRQMTRLSDTVTMYTLEFKFGFLNADMWMPMAASKTITEGNKTSSVILSTAPIQDKKYFVPMKKNRTFTLLVLEEHAVGKSKGSITVEKLPVTIQKKGEDKMLKTFTQEELEDFYVGKKQK